MFKRVGAPSTASRYCGNVSKVHGSPASRASSGMPSTFSSVRMMVARCSGLVGAIPKPQLPVTTVVTPCHDEGVRSRSHRTCASKWVWGSMNPGARIKPTEVDSRVARGSMVSATSAMCPPTTATSARRRGDPVPSTTSAPCSTNRIATFRTQPFHRSVSAPRLIDAMEGVCEHIDAE